MARGNDTRFDPRRRPSVYGMWHGGYSYSAPSVEDAEEFSSMAEAKQAMRDRYNNVGGSTPVSDQSATMDIYYGGHPKDMSDPYPDARLSFGPRGGIRHERA